MMINIFCSINLMTNQGAETKFRGGRQEDPCWRGKVGQLSSSTKPPSSLPSSFFTSSVRVDEERWDSYHHYHPHYPHLHHQEDKCWWREVRPSSPFYSSHHIITIIHSTPPSPSLLPLTMPTPSRNNFIIIVTILSTYIVIIRRTRVEEERSSTSSRTSSKSRTRERRRSYGGHSRGVREAVFVFLRHFETYLYL